MNPLVITLPIIVVFGITAWKAENKKRMARGEEPLRFIRKNDRNDPVQRKRRGEV